MYCEKLKNGKVRYIQTYKDYVSGASRKVYAIFDKDTSRNRMLAAQQLSAKIEQKRSENGFGKDLYVSTLKERYLAYLARQDKESSMIVIRNQMDILSELLGNIHIKNVTAALISQRLLETGKSNKTINTYITRWKIFYHWCYSQGYVADTDCADRLTKFKTEPPRLRNIQKYLERSELTAVLNEIQNERMRYFAKFLALTGCRIGEATALLESDVDMVNRTITINKTYSHQTHKSSSTKTETSERVIYIQDELFQMLREYRAWRLRDLFRSASDTDYLFYSARHKPFCHSKFREVFSEATLKATGRRLPVHSLRHTHASLLFEQGATLDLVSECLGHADSDITKEIYLHITKKRKSAYFEQIKKISIL